ncbi:hypothetical protein PQC39_gp058 [Vibrio phage Vp_R1]|uniref:Uncharacterized protein n=1 Tax=Vibrio phage Vp_R1 TaxID=2059867 RepID=A0A2H5BQ15_9CAUD|nr:hypothetical protein PQC39_gp058 [Vibrio phage Vp_R1]AUG88422.1 hypothetical protein VPR_058 [Vibrio phage Vp_R1]
MVYELTLNEHDYYQYKAVEDMFRSSDIYNKIFIAAKEGKNGLVASTKDIEGSGYNFRGYMISNGFTLCNIPNKRVFVSW